jgi:hypothetical protein
MTSTWTAADVPDQWGRVAVVAGANTEIGLSEELTGVTCPV